MSTAKVILDLDAAAREQAHPDGITIKFNDKTITVPSEFPLDVLDPLLDPEFDLVGLIVDVTKADTGEGVGEAIVSVLTKRRALPLELRNVLHDCLTLLMGEEQFTEFLKGRPSAQTYARLIGGLMRLYGTTLGEATASLTSSETGGATSNQTSDASTDSTPESSSDAPEPSTAS